MNIKTGTVIVLLLIALIGAGIYSFFWTFNRLQPESSPVARGANYAAIKACTECHGDPDNPMADANSSSCSNTNGKDWHPDYALKCTDLMAYFEAVRLRRTFDERSRLNPENPLLAGEGLAREYHCFQCHGQLGQGGFANPGSLKGYIPGYFGEDFSLLTNNGDPESVREWIMHGTNSELVKAPITGSIAKFFFEKQEVSMPRFRSLATEKIETLVAFVIALNRLGPMSAQSVRDYETQSLSGTNLDYRILNSR